MNNGFSDNQRSWYVSLEVLLWVAIAIAILLRLLNLATRELWYDEVLSVLLANGQWNNYPALGDVPIPLQDVQAVLNLPDASGLSGILLNLKRLLQGVANDPHPPLSYLGLQGWMYLFGHSDVALRSLMAVVSLMAVGSAYGLGTFLLNPRGGLIFAALLATNPFYLSHSLNIRMYGPLVLWTILSTWAMLKLANYPPAKTRRSPWQLAGWGLVLIGSVTAGLLTQYLFVYWGIVLAVLGLFLNGRRWWQHGLLLGTGGLLAIPWALWGTVQQLRNRSDVLDQIGKAEGIRTIALRHVQNVAKTLGSHLIVGDWTTSLPLVGVVLAGLGAIALLTFCTLQLWQNGERRLLAIALILGIFPLLLALAVDIITGKFTVGFGWGRSIIFILPGCLLLIALWLEQLTAPWQGIAISALLFLYLSLSIGDLSLRERRMFQTVGSWIEPEPTVPTLVAFNSKARGYVLRVARYFPKNDQIAILVQNSAKLAPALDATLKTGPSTYPRLLWLDLVEPVWSDPSTETDQEAVQAVLSSQYELTQEQEFSGTMKWDRFAARLYSQRKQ